MTPSPHSSVPAPAATPPRNPGEPIARRAALLASELKAQDIVVLDLRGVTDMTDFFVIASGTSDTHVRAVAEHVQAGLKATGVSTSLTEGLTQGRWALLDYTDCVVHVFHPAMRQFYQLERLWGDATRLPWDGAAVRPEPARATRTSA
jgi:ribosome-associated protein